LCGNFSTGVADELLVDAFPHDKLDVYRQSVAFLIASEEVARRLPRGRAYLVDQLRRAALSVTLNVAEGAGEYAAADKARFYRFARRSATECAAILDGCRVLSLVPAAELDPHTNTLARIVAMLTALVVKLAVAASDAS
jgi:four helix bundle protein